MRCENTLKKISRETALTAALKWVDFPENLQLINNQINCVYRFEDQGKGYYLRMTHHEIRSWNELASAIDYQRHLFLENAPICRVIASKNDQFIERVRQDDLSFLAHVCLEVPGTIIDFNDQNQSKYTAWGKSLAELHRAAQSYRPLNRKFLSWKDLWQETGNYLHNEDKGLQQLYHRIDAQFRQMSSTAHNFGLTHGDHRPGNVLYDGKKVHLIDFDEPVYHWFMADIAKPFLDLCQKPFQEWQHLFHWYLEGYRSVLPIDDPELHHINGFIQMKSLDIYLWCKNNWFEPTAPGGKPRELWLKELKHMALTPLFELN
ncbi:phosphotransferase enzyme family protein [Legionella quateirensis]|uniref:Homoserine kinase n=1 Tax=Legionella quateirensis TaxID=45072 RepID=A0A378KTQ3_9GAMM|nr:phosphotransferase [Legionella quateirensis]KTD45143.1 homoserine kinase [Legionella quateirensis]STY17001.1 Protein kinase-like [Legionella quateirensis]